MVVKFVDVTSCFLRSSFWKIGIKNNWLFQWLIDEPQIHKSGSDHTSFEWDGPQTASISLSICPSSYQNGFKGLKSIDLKVSPAPQTSCPYCHPLLTATSIKHCPTSMISNPGNFSLGLRPPRLPVPSSSPSSSLPFSLIINLSLQPQPSFPTSLRTSGTPGFNHLAV